MKIHWRCSTTHFIVITFVDPEEFTVMAP